MRVFAETLMETLYKMGRTKEGCSFIQLFVSLKILIKKEGRPNYPFIVDRC